MKKKVDPKAREGRIALAKMVIRLFDLWKLNTHEQLSLLGLQGKSEMVLARYRNGYPLPDSDDLLERVAILLSIHRSLRLLLPKNRDLRYKWPTTSNRVFKDLSPIELICKKGFQGLLAVKRYLDLEKEH